MIVRRNFLQVALAVLAVVVTISAVTLTWWYAIVDKHATIEQVRKEGQLMAVSLAEHLNVTLRDTTNIVFSAADVLEDASNHGIKLTPLQVNRALTREVVDNTSAGTIYAVDAFGEIIATSDSYPAPKASFADSPEFESFTRHYEDRGIFVGVPRVSALTSEWVFPISRAIYRKDGKFDGAVIAHIDMRYFRTFYHTLTASTQASLTILSDSGKLLFRYPSKDPTIIAPSNALPFRNVSGSSFYIINHSIFDGKTRYLSIRRLVGRPLQVAVGLEKEEVLTNWRARTRERVLTTAVGLSLFLALCLALVCATWRIQNQEDWFSFAVNAMRDGVFDYDVRKKRLYRSRRLARLLGQASPSWGRNLKELLSILPPREKRRILKAVVRHIHRKTSMTAEVVVNSGLPNESVLFISGQAVWNNSGVLKHVAGTVSDVTDLRLAERTAQRLERRYTLLFEGANDGIALLKGSEFYEVNPKIIRMFNCNSANDLVGKNLWELAPRLQPNNQISKEIITEELRLARLGFPRYLDWIFRRGDGSEFIAEISLSSVHTDGSVLVLAHVRDRARVKSAYLPS